MWNLLSNLFYWYLSLIKQYHSDSFSHTYVKKSSIFYKFAKIVVTVQKASSAKSKSRPHVILRNMRAPFGSLFHVGRLSYKIEYPSCTLWASSQHHFVDWILPLLYSNINNHAHRNVFEKSFPRFARPEENIFQTRSWMDLLYASIIRSLANSLPLASSNLRSRSDTVSFFFSSPETS